MAKTLKTVAAVPPGKPLSPDRSGRFIKKRWYPVATVILNAMLATCAELLLKIGATQPLAIRLPAPIAFLSALFSLWVVLGIIAYVGSLFLWLAALPRLPLHFAYGLASIVHILVPLACWLVLHETIPIGRLVGMLFILAGILMLGFAHK
jgi:multidrug transporter EmrE-like cation transporter